MLFYKPWHGEAPLCSVADVARERFHSVLFYWLLAGCALVPLTVAAIIVLTAHQSMVMRGIALGFKQAMKKYKVRD